MISLSRLNLFQDYMQTACILFDQNLSLVGHERLSWVPFSGGTKSKLHKLTIADENFCEDRIKQSVPEKWGSQANAPFWPRMRIQFQRIRTIVNTLWKHHQVIKPLKLTHTIRNTFQKHHHVIKPLKLTHTIRNTFWKHHQVIKPLKVTHTIINTFWKHHQVLKPLKVTHTIINTFWKHHQV